MPSHPEPSLEAGLSAIKLGDFQSAIAILEALTQTVTNSNIFLQAQIGLIVAYTKSGNIPRGITLCETLTHSQNSEVQQWANRTLEQLTLPRKDSSDFTSLVPFEQNTRITGQKPTHRNNDPNNETSLTPSFPHSLPHLLLRTLKNLNH
jgi:hypothetical protein